MKRTGIVRHERYIEHVMDPGHPESPDRLKAIYQMLDEDEMKSRFVAVKPREASREELEMIHAPEYVDLVASTAGKPSFRLDMDTSTCARSYAAALLAVGGLLELTREVLEGRLDNGFALVRPPGHHAERDRAMGFCLFNNVAIAAKCAIHRFSLQRVLIIDWDVHHGNGTQNAFYGDSQVLYFSIHRYGFFYPGTGAATEVGRGKGEGFTVNVPLATAAGDSMYALVFQKILRPIALEYRPQFILVSAGFDPHQDDPLGGMEVTPRGFSRLTQLVMKIAQETAQGRVAMTLEGGYSIHGQRDSVKAVLNQLVQVSPDEEDLTGEKSESRPSTEQTILQVKKIQEKYWKGL